MTTLKKRGEGTAALRHVRTLSDLNRGDIELVVDLAEAVKEKPSLFSDALSGRTLLMLFEKPSLRTRLSFEAGMTQLGGHGIFYSVKDSPLGVKENISDTAKCAGRFCDAVMARVKRHEDTEALAEHCGVPTINALDDRCHPCQALADCLTIREKIPAPERGSRTRLAFLGDAENNMCYALMRLGAILGWEVAVGCPADDERYAPRDDVLTEVRALAEVSGGAVTVHAAAADAVRGAHVVYTDSWLSYGTPADEREERIRAFGPFKVDAALMAQARPDAVFMNCLPADREMEQTPEVIDGAQSVVFDQAENRLHAQKALLLVLLRGSAYAEAMVAKGGLRRRCRRADAASAAAAAPPGGGVVVVAVGGNALQPAGVAVSPGTLESATRTAARDIASAVRSSGGAGAVVVHGNGPQVGALFSAQFPSGGADLNTCVAESQGQIGAALQRSIGAELVARGLTQRPVTVLTHVTVDRGDPAFGNPSKPVGAYLDADGVAAAEGRGSVVRHEKGKSGPRVVVASPPPLAIVEIDAVRALTSAGSVVIAAGGGGVPVVATPDAATGRPMAILERVDAVVDKDRAAALLARDVDAACLVILTDIDAIYSDFGSESQERIAVLTVSEAQKILDSGTLPAGSMAPKLTACVAFARETKRKAYVGSLGQIDDILAGKAGTAVTP